MFTIGHAFTMAMSIDHVAIISNGTTSFVLVPELYPQQSSQSTQGKDAHSHDSHNGENDIQQEILVRRHLIYGRAQVVGTIMTEEVADPVDGSGHRVAWLVFVNGGEKVCLLAVPKK